MYYFKMVKVQIQVKFSFMFNKLKHIMTPVDISRNNVLFIKRFMPKRTKFTTKIYVLSIRYYNLFVVLKDVS